MNVSFSELPGRHERHYRRRIDNPLFGARSLVLEDGALLEQQRLDHEELLVFVGDLRQTVQRAIDLRPNEQSDVVLALKEQLDRLYERSAGLAEDHSDNQAALTQLIEVVMRNVERGAAGDPKAMDELAQERLARSTHVAMLASPLVADLLHPESTIRPEDLCPVLLSANARELDLALQLFDVGQLSEMLVTGTACLSACPEAPATAAGRLEQIRAKTLAMRGPVAVN